MLSDEMRVLAVAGHLGDAERLLSCAAGALERLAAEFIQEEGGVWTTALMTDIGKTYATREAALSRVIQWAETGE